MESRAITFRSLRERCRLISRRALATISHLSSILLVGALTACVSSANPTVDTIPIPLATIKARKTNIHMSRPTISGDSITTNLADYSDGQIPLYGKMEISFVISNMTATNPYFPYDENTPPGVENGTGISVDAFLLPPSETNWQKARTLPCFYYQPVEEAGDGDDIALLPKGSPEWRCRFTPDAPGVWLYKIRATDAGGTTLTGAEEFTVVHSDHRGFIRVSSSDSRFFEFSDGTPFTTPLVNVEQGNPFNSLADIRKNITDLGLGGVRFIRWFPTGEGANYFVVPFGDTMRINWRFGAGTITADDPDTDAGKIFSFQPYYYSGQDIPADPATDYRLSFKAKVTGEAVLRAEITGLSGGAIDICSSTSTYHEANGNGDTCTHRQDGWYDYAIEVTNTDATVLRIAMRGLYVSTDAPSPYDVELDGTVSLHSIMLQRDETGVGDWGPNLLTRSDPDTYRYVDQRSAARLDEILRLSEQYGVYHKITLFHKNDAVLNRLQPDGTIGAWDQYSNNFYSAEGQASRWYQRAYTRYFIARWSYSPAIHSLELANENHFGGVSPNSFDAAFSLAEHVHTVSPRHILMSNSFWGWFVADFWTDPSRGSSIDYADQHWYANESGSGCEGGVCSLISNVWTDSAAYVRECQNQFHYYRNLHDYHKPIVRGEGGVAESGTEPHHPDVATETQGTYYHKKVWAHVGVLGDSCDGDWYPRLFVPDDDNQFPNSENDLFDVFSAYERFMQDEPVINGNYVEIGTDLTGDKQILVADTAGDLRAWGVRDAGSGRVLLWVDNARHTWENVVDGVTITPARGTLTIQGLPQGIYIAQWWDTNSGSITKTQRYAVDSTDNLSFAVSNLEEDVAIKFFQVKSVLFLPVVLSFASPGSAQIPRQ